MVRWPRMWGYQPVMKEQREGVQTGFWQKAWEKLTASVATKESRVGVCAAGLPRCARTSPRHWSGLKSRMWGGLGMVGLFWGAVRWGARGRGWGLVPGGRRR